MDILRRRLLQSFGALAATSNMLTPAAELQSPRVSGPSELETRFNGWANPHRKLPLPNRIFILPYPFDDVYARARVQWVEITLDDRFLSRVRELDKLREHYDLYEVCSEIPMRWSLSPGWKLEECFLPTITVAEWGFTVTCHIRPDGNERTAEGGEVNFHYLWGSAEDFTSHNRDDGADDPAPPYDEVEPQGIFCRNWDKNQQSEIVAWIHSHYIEILKAIDLDLSGRGERLLSRQGLLDFYGYESLR